MNTEMEKTEVLSSRRKKQKKLQEFDILILKRTGVPSSFRINSAKIKFLLFLLCLLILSIPICIYFLHYQYNHIAVLSAEIEQLLEISKNSTKNNLNANFVTPGSDPTIPVKQSTESKFEDIIVADKTSDEKYPNADENIEETDLVIVTLPTSTPSVNLTEDPQPSYQDTISVSTQPQSPTETEQQQDNVLLINDDVTDQDNNSEHAVVIDNIKHTLIKNKLNITFDIINKGRSQKHGYACIIIYSDKEDKPSYVIHPERVEIDENGNTLFYNRGIPFSIYSFRHINTNISMPFSDKTLFLNFLIYNNKGDMTYTETISITP